MRNMMQEVEAVKANMENCALESQLDDLAQKLKLYAPLDYMSEIKSDQMRYAKREEFNILKNEVKTLRDCTTNTMTKEETLTRFTILQSELKENLNERPTINYMKQLTTAQDAKFDVMNEALNQ